VSPDELVVTAVSVAVGPVSWGSWLHRLAKLRTRQPIAGVRLLAGALVAGTGLLCAVLRTIASEDVVSAVTYQFMYLVLGLAWVRSAAWLFPLAGLSVRDDAIERGNGAASLASAGAVLAVMICYASASVGNGPGWHVVVFCSALATVELMLTWIVFAQLTASVDTIAIDRDDAAGFRLGVLLVACALILGHSIAGDWVSISMTLSDSWRAFPRLALVVVLAIVVERRATPTAARPRTSFVSGAIVPGALYLLVAASAFAGAFPK